MWVRPHFVKDTVANALNSRMCAEDRTAPLAATVRNNKIRPRKRLRSYPEVAKYLLKKYATDAAIAEYDATILRYMQPASMTPNSSPTI